MANLHGIVLPTPLSNGRTCASTSRTKIDASHSRQPKVKVCYEVNAVMAKSVQATAAWREPEKSRPCEFTPGVSPSQPILKRHLQLLPHTVCCRRLSAMPAQHTEAPKQAQEDTSPPKIDVASKPPVGDISVVTIIRTGTTLDHYQKAKKVRDQMVKGWERALPHLEV